MAQRRNDKNEAPKGRGLWQVGSSTPEQLEASRRREAAAQMEAEALEEKRRLDNEKRETQRREKFAERRARIKAPFIAYVGLVRTKPLIAIPATLLSLAIIALGTLQITRYVAATPASVANRYIEALRQHDITTIAEMEGTNSAENWLPEELFDQITLSQPVAHSTSWSLFDDTAEFVFEFKELRDDVTLSLTRSTQWGTLGWEYRWSVEPKVTEVTFGAEKNLGPSDELVFGTVKIGNIKSELSQQLFGQTFRVAPGLVKFGTEQNGFFGGSTSATQLGNDSLYVMEFQTLSKDQNLLDQAATKAQQALEAQVSNCVDTSCKKLKWKWKDSYFTFDSAAPFYWTYKSWSDSYTYLSCDVIGNAKLVSKTTANIRFSCSYQIDRYITWEFDGTEIAYQSGAVGVTAEGSIAVSTNKQGSRLKAGTAKFSKFLPFSFD